MFLGRKAALILATVWLITNISSTQANFVTDYLAHSAYQEKDFTTAESYYQVQVRSNYHDTEALYNLGAAAYQNKNYTEARKCFEQVGATDSLTTKKRAEAYFNAGNSSVQLNELEKALEQYKTALKFDPNDQRTKTNYEKLKKLLEQQKNNPEKKQPDPKDQDPKDQDQKDQDPKDNSGESKDNQQDQKSKDQKDQTGEPKSKDGVGQDQKKSPEQKSPEQKSKDQSGEPKDNQNSPEQKNNSGQKSGEQKSKEQTGQEQKPAPVNHPGPDQQAKLDPELKELMQAAQASDRAVNKQIMQYQMNQAGGQNSAEQGNNW